MQATALAKVVLSQAQGRTKLLVECARLLKRWETLDKECADQKHWRKIPHDKFLSGVSDRFQEARRREAREAAKLYGTDAFAVASLEGFEGQNVAGFVRNLRANVNKVVANGDPGGDHERLLVSETNNFEKTAAGVLQDAVRTLEFEAEMWRTRMLEFPQSDEDKIALKDLQSFELCRTLAKEEGEEEIKKRGTRDRHVVADNLAEEYQALKINRDEIEKSLNQAQTNLAETKLECQRLLGVIDSRTAEIEMVQADAGRVRVELEVERAKTTRFASEFQKIKLSCSPKAIQAQCIEIDRLIKKFGQKDAECCLLRRECARLNSENQGERHRADVLEKQIEAFRSEFEARADECHRTQARLDNAARRYNILEEAYHDKCFKDGTGTSHNRPCSAVTIAPSEVGSSISIPSATASATTRDAAQSPLPQL